MGNTDSKFNSVYQHHLYKLATFTDETHAVPVTIPLYTENDQFNSFYTEFISLSNGLSIETYNSLIAHAQLRNIIQLNYPNYSNVIHYTLKMIVQLHTQINSDTLPTLQTCIRILTKLIPVYYEHPASHPAHILTDSTLCDEVVSALTHLCFVEGYTIPLYTTPGSINTEAPWDIGIATSPQSRHPPQSPRFDANRLEILNLILALASKDLYNTTQIQNEFTQALLQSHTTNTVLARSLLNLYCNYAVHYKEQLQMPYEHISSKMSLQQNLHTLKSDLVITSLQLFNLLCLTQSDHSDFITDLLNNEYDLKLLLTAIVKMFKFPIDQAIDQESNLLNFNTKSQSDETSQQKSNETMQLPKVQPVLIPTLFLLFNLIKFNKTFENYFADKFANKFLVFALYYIKFYNNIPEYQSNLIPLCYNLSLHLTSKGLILYKLLQTFTVNYYTNKLPNFFKISNISQINQLTYRDFILIQLSNLAITDIKKNQLLKPYIFELIYNLLPINSTTISENTMDSDANLVQLSSLNCNPATTDKLSYNATISILNVLAKLSNKTYLSSFFQNSSSQTKWSSPVLKLDLLALLLRSVLIYIVTCFNESKNLTFLLARHHNILLQIKESINYISSNKNLNDMLFMGNLPIHHLIDMNLNSAINGNSQNDSTTPTDSNTDLNDESDNNMQEPEHNLLYFNKPLVDYSDDEDEDDNNDNRTCHWNQVSGKYVISSESNETNGANNTQATNMEVYEHPDFQKQIIQNDDDLFVKLRPHWPIGLTQNYKLKSPKDSNFIDLWTGSKTLNILIQITKVFLLEFPEITKMSKNSDFVKLIEKFDAFEPTYKEKINSYLSLSLLELTTAKPLVFRLTKSQNPSLNNWLYKIYWSNVFQTHSTAYTKSNDFAANETATKSLSQSQASHVRRNESISSTTTIPILERWSSQGSNLSRTQSNSSSIVSYFTQDMNVGGTPEQVSLTPTMTNSSLLSSSIGNEKSQFSSSVNSNGNRKDSGSSSFFKFSWTGFNKNDNQENSIQEESGNDNFVNDSRNFTMDQGLLKENIWVGTRIKLFQIKTIEKEEFSFLDMTSSLLKKFRFNNSNSFDNNATNYDNNSNGNDARQYSPTLSANPFMAFATTKRYY